MPWVIVSNEKQQSVIQKRWQTRFSNYCYVMLPQYSQEFWMHSLSEGVLPTQKKNINCYPFFSVNRIAWNMGKGRTRSHSAFLHVELHCKGISHDQQLHELWWCSPPLVGKNCFLYNKKYRNIYQVGRMKRHLINRFKVQQTCILGMIHILRIDINHIEYHRTNFFKQTHLIFSSASNCLSQSSISFFSSS